LTLNVVKMAAAKGERVPATTVKSVAELRRGDEQEPLRAAASMRVTGVEYQQLGHRDERDENDARQAPVPQSTSASTGTRILPSSVSPHGLRGTPRPTLLLLPAP